MQGGIKRYPYEQNLTEFPDDAKVLNFRKLYNLSVTTGAQAEFQSFLRETIKNKVDFELFKRYKLDVPAYMKSIAEKQAASSTKLQELESKQKALEDEAKWHLEQAAKQDVIIADARKQQDALATQFAMKMDLGTKQAATPAASSGPTSSSSAANKKVVVM